MNTPSPFDRTTISPAAALAQWLPAAKPRASAKLRLIAFPYAGGGTSVFRAWPDHLPETIELRVVQLPGRGSRLREQRFEAVLPAIDALEQHLVSLLDRPFAFFGHSMGALLAFEMTRRLQARGLTPAHLFVSGHMAPQLKDPTPLIHQLPDVTFLEKLKELNGMTQAVLDTPELLEIVLPIIRADFKVLETYRYQGIPPSLSCPLMALGGDRDPRATREGLEAWRVQTTGSFDLRIFPGDHFFIDQARSDLIPMIVRKLADAGAV